MYYDFISLTSSGGSLLKRILKQLIISTIEKEPEGYCYKLWLLFWATEEKAIFWG